jgi:hypothetical protein
MCLIKYGIIRTLLALKLTPVVTSIGISPWKRLNSRIANYKRPILLYIGEPRLVETNARTVGELVASIWRRWRCHLLVSKAALGQIDNLLAPGGCP